jgi:hypothetical protein
MSSGRRIGCENSADRSAATGPTGIDGRAGTSTSSIVWTKNVALARISTSSSRDADWSGIFASASRRWIRSGE